MKGGRQASKPQAQRQGFKRRQAPAAPEYDYEDEGPAGSDEDEDGMTPDQLRALKRFKAGPGGSDDDSDMSDEDEEGEGDSDDGGDGSDGGGRGRGRRLDRLGAARDDDDDDEGGEDEDEDEEDEDEDEEDDDDDDDDDNGGGASGRGNERTLEEQVGTCRMPACRPRQCPCHRGCLMPSPSDWSASNTHIHTHSCSPQRLVHTVNARAHKREHTTYTRPSPQ